MSRSSPAVAAVLAQLAREHDWNSPVPGLSGLLSRCPPADLRAAIRYHRIVGCAWLTLRHEDRADPETRAWAERGRNFALAGHLRACSALHGVADVLAAAGVDWLVFKGPVLAETVYGRPDLRAYSDVDILVRPGQFARSVAALEAAGCEVVDRNWRLYRRITPGEVHLVTPSGVVLDLHWHLVNDRRVRGAFSIDVHEVLDGSVPLPVAGRAVPGMREDHAIAHLGLHSALSGADRLLQLKDMEQYLLREADWDAVARTAAQWGALIPLAVAVGRAERFLGAPSPPGLGRRLLGKSPVRAAISAADRLSPVPRLLSAESTARIVARAGRSSVSATSRELIRRSVSHVLTATVARSRRFDPTDPFDPGKGSFPAGTPEDRRAFFAFADSGSTGASSAANSPEAMSRWADYLPRTRPTGPDDTDLPSVRVVIPVFDDERLVRCLHALARQDYPADRFRVVVVDNASTRDPRPLLSGFDFVTLLHEPKPGSYAARNTGIACSSGDVLAFTDSDCLPEPGWLSSAVAVLMSGAEMVAGKVEVFARTPARPHPVEAYEVVKAFPQERYVLRSGWCATANMVVWAQVFAAVGPFCDRLKSGGDAEWGQRATAKGHAFTYVEDAVVRHPARATYSEMYAKLLRVREGQRDQDRLNNVPDSSRISPRDLLPPLGALRRAFTEPRLPTGRARLAYVAGETFVRYAGVVAVLRTSATRGT